MKVRGIYILLGLALVLACAESIVFVDCIGIFAFAWYAMIPFIHTKTVRAPWAKFTILLNGLFGMALSALFLTLHSGWLTASPHAKHALNDWLSFAGGITLGVTLTLMFSGQIFGTRRDNKENPNLDTIENLSAKMKHTSEES